MSTRNGIATSSMSYTRRASRIPAPPSRSSRVPPGTPLESYVVLTQSGMYEGTWYFIRWEGNEDVLRHLQDQLEKTSGQRITGESDYVFSLDTEHRLPAVAVGEMLELVLNEHTQSVRLNRKMRTVDLGFTNEDLRDGRAMLEKAIGTLGDRVEEFFD